MRLRRALPVLALVVALVGVEAGSGRVPAFEATVAPIGPELRARMIGVSWRGGCPVPLRDLRLVTAPHWGFDGRVHSGAVVVHEDVAAAVVSVLRRLYTARFPIRRMRPIEAYGGSDFASIEDDNTSAFNCRRATGSRRWSEHAYGRAIDVNPIENPYVEAGRVYHTASRSYVDRSGRRPGMASPGGVLVDAFRDVGWGWGGEWTGSVKDYQHFSTGGS
jgi:hypothetical protein